MVFIPCLLQSVNMSHHSLKQALALAKSAQYLIGLPFSIQGPGWEICCVTACPADNEMKDRFLFDYNHYRTKDLTEYIEADAIDVMVIAGSMANPQKTVAEELGVFLAKTEVKLVA